MSKRKDGTHTGNPQMMVRWDSDDLDRLQVICEYMGWKPQDVVRRGAMAIVKRYERKYGMETPEK